MSENRNWSRADLGSAPSSEESTEIRLPSYHLPNNSHPKIHADLEQDCLAAMAENGLPFDGSLVADGVLRRYSCDQKKNQPDEWYIAFCGISEKGNPYLNCVFGTWSGGGEKFHYNSWDNDRAISKEEREEIKSQWEEKKKQAEDVRAKEEAQRAEKVQNDWSSASDGPNGAQAYLDRKKVGVYGVRFGSCTFNDDAEENPKWDRHDTIIIPLRNIEGDLRSVQHIRADGEKRIYGPKKGNFHLVGEIGPGSRILVAEGYATGVSVHAQSGDPVVIAVDCGNVDPVLFAIRKKYPKHRILILGDDDVETKDKQGRLCNPGRAKAEAAAKKHECLVAFPKFSEHFRLPPDKNGERRLPTDWNDLLVHFGTQDIRKQLETFEKPKPRLITLSHKDLLNKNIPPRKFVISPWLPEAGISMVFAPPGVGKTYLCLSAAKAIASGGELFNWKAPEQRRVLYLDGEMHESDLQLRVKKLLGNESILDNYLLYLNGSWQSDLFLPDLSTIEGQKLIEEVINFQETEVLFIDNLSTLCRTGKENEIDSWRQMQNWLLQLRWRGITSILVHHAGKTKDAMGRPVQRGTSMREVILESSLSLDHPKDYREEDGCVFELRYAKARGVWGADAAPIEARLTEKNGVFVWEHKLLSIKNYDRVVELFNSNMTNANEIAKELGISRQAVQKHIDRAKKDGDIR